MIDKKLENFKRLLSQLDQRKMQNSEKVDSISLISENLSRTRQQRLNHQSKASSMTGQNSNSKLPEMTESKLTKFEKIRSFQYPSPELRKSPKLLYKYVNQDNKKKVISLARRLYEARCQDMGIKHTEIGWQQFKKTFLLKNSTNAQFKADKVNLSGLGLHGNALLIANQILTQYKSINLSRNIIHISDFTNLRYCNRIEELNLRNCGMKNQQLCLLFKILLQTPIKRLSICSPDLKDRNILTRYQQLYQLIEKSATIREIEMSNVQISPQCQIFQYAKKSKTLKKLNLSKNTGVVGMSKNLEDLNLSWNGITNPLRIKCVESSLLKLDITGNKIPCYKFQEIFTTSNFPVLKSFTANKISLHLQSMWLQIFIQKSKSLQSLSLIDCQLTKVSYLNIIYGLEHNQSIKHLNLSSNKFPSIQVAQNFVTSLQKSGVSHLYLELCDIKDEYGAILFKFLENNHTIQYIDVSKNNLSQKTSETICSCLKFGCYNLMVLITTQNFIKYDQLKEIGSYIDRNIYVGKSKMLQQHKRYKTMSASSTQMIRKIQQAEQKLLDLKKETEQMESEFMEKMKENKGLTEMILEQKLKQLVEEQVELARKKESLEAQLQKLNEDEENPELST